MAKALGFAGSLGFSEGPALTLLGFAGLSFAPARLLLSLWLKSVMRRFDVWLCVAGNADVCIGAGAGHFFDIGRRGWPPIFNNPLCCRLLPNDRK